MDLKINWKTDRRKVADLKHWDKNPRKISRQKAELLKERIRERGFHDVIKIDLNNVILSGNCRTDVLLELGIEEVNVLVPDRELTAEEMEKIGLESNMNDGEWDFSKMKDNFEINTLLETGFNSSELSFMFDVPLVEDEFDEDKAIEEAKKTEIKNGDVYQLGDHKLMCGDSTNFEDVEKLMGEERATMIYSDPPYNIKLSYAGGGRNKK